MHVIGTQPLARLFTLVMLMLCIKFMTTFDAYMSTRQSIMTRMITTTLRHVSKICRGFNIINNFMFMASKRQTVNQLILLLQSVQDVSPKRNFVTKEVGVSYYIKTFSGSRKGHTNTI